MKKTIVIILAVLLLVMLAGCNYKGYDFFDNDYHFDRAIIRMPDGSTKEIALAKWTDAEDGEQLTLTSTDGTRYLVHSANCVLVEDK